MLLAHRVQTRCTDAWAPASIKILMLHSRQGLGVLGVTKHLNQTHRAEVLAGFTVGLLPCLRRGRGVVINVSSWGSQTPGDVEWL